MFSKYVEAAMKLAEYEKIEDGTYVGSIPGFRGVLGNAASIEECREDLSDALEGWLVLGLWMNDETLPKLGKLDLVPHKFVAARKNESAPAPRSRKAS